VIRRTGPRRAIIGLWLASAEERIISRRSALDCGGASRRSLRLRNPAPKRWLCHRSQSARAKNRVKDGPMRLIHSRTG